MDVKTENEISLSGLNTFKDVVNLSLLSNVYKAYKNTETRRASKQSEKIPSLSTVRIPCKMERVIGHLWSRTDGETFETPLRSNLIAG